MGKRTWMDVGITVLGLFLVCNAAVGVAQNPGTERSARESSSGSAMTGQVGGSGQAGGSQQAADVEVQQWRELAQLRAEVSRLQQEVARMQARLSPGMETESQGTGGGGSAGIGDPNAEAPAGATGLGDIAAEGVGGGGRAGGAQAARPDTSNEGVAVAHIIHTGRVRSVSPRELVLVDEDGGSKTLVLANDVRVFRGREQVSPRSLREGTVVRASADLYTRDHPVIEIQVLPSQGAARE
jgi:hypothetical protein